MRRSALALLVSALFSALVTACSFGTEPDATVLHIRLLDDGGAPAGRHTVVVTTASGPSVTRLTGLGGTLDLTLSDGVAYRVRIIPRAGFVSGSSLSREVTLPAHERTVVEFTVQRQGVSVGDPSPG